VALDGSEGGKCALAAAQFNLAQFGKFQMHWYFWYIYRISSVYIFWRRALKEKWSPIFQR